MVRTAIGVVSLGLVLAGSIAVAPASSARGCVSPDEFAKAKTGMSVSQVAKIFGTNGKVMSKTSGYGITIIIRDYDACTQFGAVSVLYENGRLQTKSGIF